jgi:hypothetical protein
LISVAEIYRTLRDEKSLRLFLAVAEKDGDTADFSAQLNLSRKEYYLRMSKFLKTGLVKRKKTRYFLTAFGVVVYDAEEAVRKAVESAWKLKALDSIDFSDEIAPSERKKLLDALLDDLDIRQILSKEFLKTHGENLVNARKSTFARKRR